MYALVGSGEYLPAIELVDQYLFDQLSSSPRVVCLPTAAGAEGNERISYWMSLANKYFSGLGVQVESLPVIDSPSANQPEFVEKILESNFIYLSGGRPDYLLQTLKGSLVWEAIQEVISHNGVLAGCSAGAMILGERIPAFPTWRKAFNLVADAVIIPHFDEISDRLTSVMKLFIGKGSTLIGIDGFTALYGNSNKYYAIGKGTVTVWNKSGKQCYMHGQAIPFWGKGT